MQKILVATDFSDKSKTGLLFVIQLAPQNKFELTFFSCLQRFNTGFVETMVVHIETVIKKMKPSVMIIFTEQNRSLFQKIFLPGKPAEYSFNAKVPLLVFNKASK